MASSTIPSIRCQHCGAENTADARYCEACGVELANPAADTLPMGRASRAAAPMLALVREQLAADYDVGGELGRGGMAIVYKAVERDLRRTVALKVLPPELALGPQVVDRFKREAQMAAALDHPNIIPIYRVGQTEKLLYLAMKYVEGKTLDSVIAQQGALPLPVVVSVLRATASALAYAHEHGIVHRDIKPANVLIDADGRVIVTDFGVARAMENASMTTTGSVIGTPYFMSPEQCAGKIAGPPSDQYSLGVVAFQMLTGAVPFKADTLAAIMHHHFFTPVPDVRVVRDDVPPELIAILNRVLSKDPERRYTSTRSLVADLEQVPLTPDGRTSGEVMLRELAHGGAVPSVSTEAMPPLADTMRVVAAHDAMMRSAERFGRARRRARWIVGVVVLAAIGLWVWVGRPRRPMPLPLLPAASVVARAPIPTPIPVTVPTTLPVAPPVVVARRRADTVRPVVDTAVTVGKLRVRVFPSDADIAVDGRDVGQGAVMDESFHAGTRQLHVSAPGYVPYDTTFVVITGVTTQLSHIILKATGTDP